MPMRSREYYSDSDLFWIAAVHVIGSEESSCGAKYHTSQLILAFPFSFLFFVTLILRFTLQRMEFR